LKCSNRKLHGQRWKKEERRAEQSWGSWGIQESSEYYLSLFQESKSEVSVERNCKQS
jgi:hypothetical protein